MGEGCTPNKILDMIHDNVGYQKLDFFEVSEFDMFQENGVNFVLTYLIGYGYSNYYFEAKKAYIYELYVKKTPMWHLNCTDN